MKILENLFVYPEMGMLDSNTYVFTGRPGLIIDPGSPDYLSEKVSLMRRDGVDAKNIGIIVNTHLHLDHCSANGSFKKLSGGNIALHPVQEKNYRFQVVDGARFFGFEPQEFAWDFVFDGDRLKAGAAEFGLLPSPGHSPDSVCYYHPARKILICGDVLFEMNTGRVDLPGGEADALKISIDRLSKLDVELLLPGHGAAVSGAAAVARNFEYIRKEVFPWL